MNIHRNFIRIQRVLTSFDIYVLAAVTELSVILCLPKVVLSADELLFKQLKSQDVLSGYTVVSKAHSGTQGLWVSVERCGSQGKVFVGVGETNHNRSVVRLCKANGLAFLVPCRWTSQWKKPLRSKKLGLKKNF